MSAASHEDLLSVLDIVERMLENVRRATSAAQWFDMPTSREVAGLRSAIKLRASLDAVPARQPNQANDARRI